MQLKQAFYKNRYFAMAFAIPVFLMLLVMAVIGSEPFGDRSMLYSDMYHQYYPFFVEFRRALLSGEVLTFNWSVGLGMDYLALIAYYLASPLNLLAVFVPESLMLEFFSLLMPVKLGLASLFFAIFLSRSFQRNDISLPVFGGFYGMCAWALGYQWNIMWLDSFALLPLMALGTVELLRDRKYVLYTLILFLSVAANYYIGFFVCIFVFLLFCYYEICNFQGFGRFFRDLGCIAVFTLIALGLTAFLELPAFLGLQNTQSSVNKFPTEFRLNIAPEHTLYGLIQAMGQVAGNMAGGLEPTFKEGLPNVYCGVGTVLLAATFLTCKNVKLREKLCGILMLLFINVSFIIRQLDYIWHGMHFTNMIPYRFSFLYSFILLYMAYRTWLHRSELRPWQLIVGGVLSGALLALSPEREEWTFLAYNVTFLVLYFVALVYCAAGKAPDADAQEDVLRAWKLAVLGRRRRATLALTTVMALELVANIVNFGIRFPSTAAADYPKGTEDTEAVIDYMEQREQDTLFYRAETTHSQTLNDGAINGYHGVSTFTSSANVKVTEFMQALGYGAKNTYNRYCFEESSPVANLFLGLKYMIERNGNVEENRYFTDVFSSGKVHLLENQAYLPLGFLADQDLALLDWSSQDRFMFQNELFRCATGLYDDVWIMQENYEIGAENVTLDQSNDSWYCAYSGAGADASITYTFTVEGEGFLCLDFNVTDRNNYKVFKNGTQLYSESLSLPQMIAVSDVVPGDIIGVRLECDSGESGNMTVKAAVLDDTVFAEGYEILSASTLELTDFSSNRVRGTVDCDRNGLLYTSIPQDGNWRVIVDGQEVEPTLVGDVMISVYLSEGRHFVEFEYFNTAFSYGWKISALCGLVFLVALLVYHPNKKYGKYEKRA